MDPRIVTPAECFSVSAAWLEINGDLMLLLESKDATRGLLGQVTVAHQELSRLVSNSSTTNQKLQETRALADNLDEAHDSTFKGIYYALMSVAEFEPGRKEEIYLLRDHLFPDGLAGTTRAYAAQAGEAGLLEARLGPSHRAALEAIKINNSTLLDKVETLIKIGKQLGVVEAQKKALITELEIDPEPSLSEINEGKGRWFAVANLFSGVIRYAGFSAQEKIKLLAPIEALEKTFQDRLKERARKKAETKPTETKPTETKPTETKPIETKPIETKAPESTPKKPNDESPS
jgi:hypothetical protein